jgi:Family of unknown function (DUF5335)
LLSLMPKVFCKTSGGVAVRSQRFDRSELIGACAAVSRGLLGKRAEIEVLSPVRGIVIQARGLPVIGIAYDSERDALRIMLEGLDHFVSRPREMYLDFGDGGFQSLGILDQDNAWQVVVLRDPVMLPRRAGA